VADYVFLRPAKRMNSQKGEFIRFKLQVLSFKVFLKRCYSGDLKLWT
jgi:hypothetical protein